MPINHKSIVIAIDGPAGAGKSTVAKLLAQKLGLQYLDTGAMYRAIALKAQRNNVTLAHLDAAVTIAKSSEITFGEHGVMLDGEDISSLIRTPEIGELASALSTISEIRKVLVEQQQKLIVEGGYVLEGRDTTTVVAPNATLKVFLTASLEERTQRRLKELEEKGIESDYQTLLRQISERDHRDYTREDSPLKIASDAIRLESFGIAPEIVTQQIIDALKTTTN